MNKENLVYFLIRLLTYPLRFLPGKALHFVGRLFGRLAFYFMHDYRKRTLSNLALAKDLHIQGEKELKKIAKASFENLAINILEYVRFDRIDDFSQVIRCVNPSIADELYKKGHGIIFFCGHQSNWEALFLDGTSRMQGIAIGKSIKNTRLYHWILSIRQKKGGRIIAPRNAVKEGLRALRKGVFMGIVGDQGMPDSGYSFPFLGRRAWTSTAPALLSYKTNSPIIVATTRRVGGGYRIHYSDPIWPQLEQPLESEIKRLMDHSLTLLEESIKLCPGEWLWQHNRWKQQTPDILYKRFRHDCICLILPDDDEAFEKIASHLPTLKQIYPLNFLFLIVPERFKSAPLCMADEVIVYRTPKDMLVTDYRFKLIFNFTSYDVAKHYRKLSAFEILDIPALQKIAKGGNDLSDVLKKALCRPGTI